MTAEKEPLPKTASETEPPSSTTASPLTEQEEMQSVDREGEEDEQHLSLSSPPSSFELTDSIPDEEEDRISSNQGVIGISDELNNCMSSPQDETLPFEPNENNQMEEDDALLESSSTNSWTNDSLSSPSSPSDSFHRACLPDIEEEEEEEETNGEHEKESSDEENKIESEISCKSDKDKQNVDDDEYNYNQKQKEDEEEKKEEMDAREQLAILMEALRLLTQQITRPLHILSSNTSSVSEKKTAFHAIQPDYDVPISNIHYHWSLEETGFDTLSNAVFQMRDVLYSTNIQADQAIQDAIQSKQSCDQSQQTITDLKILTRQLLKDNQQWKSKCDLQTQQISLLKKSLKQIMKQNQLLEEERVLAVMELHDKMVSIPNQSNNDTKNHNDKNHGKKGDGKDTQTTHHDPSHDPTLTIKSKTQKKVDNHHQKEENHVGADSETAMSTSQKLLKTMEEELDQRTRELRQELERVNLSDVSNSYPDKQANASNDDNKVDSSNQIHSTSAAMAPIPTKVQENKSDSTAITTTQSSANDNSSHVRDLNHTISPHQTLSASPTTLKSSPSTKTSVTSSPKIYPLPTTDPKRKSNPYRIMFTDKIGLQFQKIPLQKPSKHKTRNKELNSEKSKQQSSLEDQNEEEKVEVTDKQRQEDEAKQTEKNETKQEENDVDEEEEEPCSSDFSICAYAFIVIGTHGFDAAANGTQPPTIGARLIGLNDYSFERGTWGMDDVRKLLSTTPKPIFLTFRDDPLLDFQYRMIQKTIKNSKIVDGALVHRRHHHHKKDSHHHSSSKKEKGKISSSSSSSRTTVAGGGFGSPEGPYRGGGGSKYSSYARSVNKYDMFRASGGSSSSSIMSSSRRQILVEKVSSSKPTKMLSSVSNGIFSALKKI